MIETMSELQGALPFYDAIQSSKDIVVHWAPAQEHLTLIVKFNLYSNPDILDVILNNTIALDPHVDQWMDIPRDMCIFDGNINNAPNRALLAHPEYDPNYTLHVNTVTSIESLKEGWQLTKIQ